MQPLRSIPTVKIELEVTAEVYAALDVWADVVLDEPLEAVLEFLTYELASNDGMKTAAARLMKRHPDTATNGLET
ncbi:hypothetical protein SAMN05216377_110135 [Pseudonocardia oroxyli]|uniref:Uncharacterized protein n=1 Tax=Pseudonocardia oroxyli TaxID=366584 RepID=A0A1G7T013_PSEOR|nr:hypothetical protein SAMN05216377_110135 [Pseudonocardia oroxyli]